MSQDRDALQADALDRPGPPPELRDPPRRSRALGAFLATFALAAFAGVVWYAYDRGLQAGSEATAPLIQADRSPIKVRPEQPGGLDVPNQDKLVYGALRPGQGEGATVERLLPPPEAPAEPPKPLAIPEPVAQDGEDRGGPVPTAPDIGALAGGAGGVASAPAGSTTVTIPPRTPKPVTTQPATGNAPAAAPPAPTPVSPPSPQPAAQPAPAPAAQPGSDDIPPAQASAPVAIAPPPPVPQPPVPQPKPEVAVAPPQPAPAPQQAAAPPPAPAPSGQFRVQLGAFRDEAAARREWDRLTRRYPNELSGLTLRIQRVDLGAGKGVFHRIQGGMLSEAAADGICATLKARNQGCLLVRP